VGANNYRGGERWLVCFLFCFSVSGRDVTLASAGKTNTKGGTNFVLTKPVPPFYIAEAMPWRCV